jgi:phospholipid-binding lipoprotein MlaA
MSKFPLSLRSSVIWLVIALVSACAQPPVGQDIYDPHEIRNREIHEGNRKLDRGLLRPMSRGYGQTFPEPVRIGVGNFAANLSIPGIVVNDLLQLNLEDAVHNSLRFLVNSTVGLGGFLDPVQAAGIDPRDTDFGETLHVWGVSEGAYQELPLFGPSTARDTAGMLVDILLDPVNALMPPSQVYILPIATTAALLGDRYRFQATVDSILYDSADSYAQSRLLYLENRRFQLGDTSADTDDLYEGLYDDFSGQ